MWKKIAVLGGLSVAALGVGGVVLAETASAATPGTAAGTHAHHGHAGKHGKLAKDELKDALHGTWVTKDGKTGAFVTHDAIRGQVTAVSASSVTVKAADNTSETYAVNSSTRVHAKGDTKASPGTIAQVKVGDQVGVVGTGTSSLTATAVLDRGVPKPHTPKTGTSGSTAPTTS